MRYAPLYIHSFALYAPRKILEATELSQRYRDYEKIGNVADRLRWCRHSKGLTQREAAEKLGMSHNIYKAIEKGVTQQIRPEIIDRLAQLYGVPKTDFMDDYSRFLMDGQARFIRECRERQGMGRKTFAKFTGIPLSSLREWESGKKTVSRKAWEKYFEKWSEEP